MKPNPQMQWVAIDLHVHTPASKDYQGPRDDAEYLALLRRANEFEKKISNPKDSTARPISCVCFTDHNSVEGFKTWRTLFEKTSDFAEAVRERDPNNPLLKQLDDDLAVLRSIRVLMGVEIKAYPGVHLLLVFKESIAEESVENFLTVVYGKPYRDIAGDPEPTTTLPIERLLDSVMDSFGSDVLVIAPHIENSGGLYECLKELPAVRMQVLKHSALAALSFNKTETRVRVEDLFSQPQFKRTAPITFIQSSDSHGSRGAIGHPRTEVQIANSRVTFSSIREAFTQKSRVKCSVDLIDEEYRANTEGEEVAVFQSAGVLGFKDADRDELTKFVCASLNQRNGVVVLDATGVSDLELKKFPKQVEEQFKSMIGSILEPDSFHLLSRVLNYSSSRVKVLLKPINSGRLYVTDGRAFIHDKPTPRPAKSHEIEFIVGKNITRQFGDRFEETLDGVARQSVLLAKVPEAIPLLLRTRPMFTFVSPKQLSAHRIPPASQRGREFSDELDDLAERAKKVSPFGVSGGTCTFVQDYVMKAREQDHYMRFLAVRADASSDASSRLQSETLNSQSLLVVPGGAVMLAEGGPVVTRATLYSLKVPKGFDGKELALLAWIKSAFFIWYCSVYLGEPDLFMLLFNASVRFPIPTMQGNEEFFARLEINTKNLILEERHFLDDVARMTRKDPGSSEIEKLRNRHNKAANAYALAIDKEVSAFLKLEEDEQIFIAETLLNLKMTDFGLIDELQQIEAAKEAKVEV